MVLRKLTGVFAIALVIGAASFAVAGVPDLGLSTASHAAAFAPVMYNLPNGLGTPFYAANSLSGAVNATITLTVRDGSGAVVPNFSASNMWLEKEVAAGTGNFIACTNGSSADFNTDASGVTLWADPLRAGGWSTSKTLVIINGFALTSNTGLVMKHNSADMNGNGVANLSDLGEFATDYFSGLHPFKGDLAYDGFMNLSDIGKLASGLGAACP